jgi:hypothetical protein
MPNNEIFTIIVIWLKPVTPRSHVSHRARTRLMLGSADIKNAQAM